MADNKADKNEQANAAQNAKAEDATKGATKNATKDAWISKKDLLKETNISYGQLYRWKREGLLPEEWFDKRSAPTGQETYFPRELVLTRIATIKELKNDKSLDEIAEVLPKPMSREAASIASELLANDDFIGKIVEKVAAKLAAGTNTDASTDTTTGNGSEE
jgi:DNA-binding transcriptional MerR regulator